MKIFILSIFCALLVSHSVFGEDKSEPNIDDEIELDNDSVNVNKKLIFATPKIPDHHFLMYFSDAKDLTDIWVTSETKKDGVEDTISKYDGVWAVEVPQSSVIENDFALVLKSKARHAAVSSKLVKPFDFTMSKQFVVQYEVKFQNGQECGGAYIKLLSDFADMDLKKFHDKTRYTVMFGPDKCGNDNKLHFIFQHKNPVNGQFEEKHAKKPNSDIDRHFTDKKSHLYTLVVNSDNTFEIFIDQSLVNSGSLLKDFEPSVNPPKEVDDPEDKKPEDWDDRAKIADPTATKPADWDESAPEYIEDAAAVKPEGWLDQESLTVPDEAAARPADWDNEMDGEWEPPRIDNPACKTAPGCGPWTASKIKNPAYKGKWTPAMIDNPAYKGQWSPRKIANPHFFEDVDPFHGLASIGAVGLELWSMSDEIVFDNFIIADSKKTADEFAADTFMIKKDAERRADPNAQSVVDAIREATSERPWLWLVMALVVGLPVVLIVVYCCRSGSSSSQSGEAQRRTRMAASEHKKQDDEGVPEDDEEEEEEEADVVAAAEAAEAATEASCDTMAAGDNKAELESDSEPEKEAVSEQADQDLHQKPSGDRSSSDSAGNTPIDGQATRKRRARKE